MAGKQQSKDIVQLLRLLEVEQTLGDIEVGDLVFFSPRKMSMSVIHGVAIDGPGRWRSLSVPLNWSAGNSNTGMFLQIDAWHMRFLLGENIVEVGTKDFGSLWTIRKVGS